ncbi:MAG: hypothetical protein HY726_22205 [Candidatus Rokubacteria bacterium]|nr:hypothetical protein [Candidatus Rokubacteria bacterium]
MRKEYGFSRRVRRNPYAPRVERSAGTRAVDRAAEDEPPLTLAQMRELDRRVKDLHDRTRYLLVSAFGPRFALYYNASQDTYGMNEPVHATLFKRRAAALAIRRMLGGGVEIARCRVDRRGRLVLNSLGARRWRPPQTATKRRRR